YGLVIIAVLPGIIFSFSPLWSYAKSPSEWVLWDYVDQTVDKNDYLLTNNYGMVEVYSRPSDYLIKDWQVDSIRFLMFDTEYALIEPDVGYPKQFPEIFTPVRTFNFDTYENNISLVLYQIDLDKLSKIIYGDGAIKVTGKLYDITTGVGIQRAKMYVANPNTGQIIGTFYSKTDGTVVAYLPAYSAYLLQVNAFGYESKTVLGEVSADKVIICESQMNCYQKPNLEIGLIYKSFIVHEHPSVRF
ncbi:MAG TPA: hypothetical protein VJ201_09340, partial [Candidatus Babeliales bacterium]|nr:hypothetical protein [Candidatus Babeliales bacterium]